jgi:hypothetical protein
VNQNVIESHKSEEDPIKTFALSFCHDILHVMINVASIFSPRAAVSLFPVEVLIQLYVLGLGGFRNICFTRVIGSLADPEQLPSFCFRSSDRDGKPLT